LAWVALFASACSHHQKSTTITPGGRAPLAVTSDPMLVEMTVEPTSSLVASNATSELGIRVRITAKELPPAKRPPLDLALVLDTSGSMEGGPIDSLRSSARALAGKLRDGDRISVVTFDSISRVLVPNTVVSPRNRGDIDKAIAGIRATGTTDLVGGLSQGLGQLLAGQFPQGINRIVLLSDGVPNSSVALPAMIASVHAQGVSVTSLGFGVDYDTVLMTQIARDTGGNFHYLDKPEDVATVFDAELVKMTTAVARNMQLYLQSGPGVTIPAMPGIQPTGDGRVLALIGDLPAGETRDLMIPISLASRGDGTIAELANVTLAFDDVIGRSGQQKREGFVAAKVSNDTAAVKAAVKMDLEVSRIRATAAAATLQAINLARAGQVAQARAGLATAITAIKTAGKKLKDPADLDALVKELEELSQELAQIVVPQRQIVSDVKRPTVQDMPVPATAPAPVEKRLRRSEEKAESAVMGQNPN
jgi:Ca-activated chloride channel family protein